MKVLHATSSSGERLFTSRTRWSYTTSLLMFLAIGNLIAWSTITLGFIRFYRVEGTFLKFTNCVFPNPLITPCFFGAIAFLIALVWAVSLLSVPMPSAIQGYTRLWRFLLAATIFGWSNVAYEFWKWNQSPSGLLISCSAQSVSSPFQSSCLYGSAMFLAAWLAVGLRMRKAT